MKTRGEGHPLWQYHGHAVYWQGVQGDGWPRVTKGRGGRGLNGGWHQGITGELSAMRLVWAEGEAKLKLTSGPQPVV